MKYGLVYYHNTENVGDDILSYAAKRFLPQVDYYIEREAMNLFVPEEKEYVAAILNGWYLHFSYEFPPSPYLLPLFTGTHFTKDPLIFGDYSYLDGIAADYLKRHAPVGCRDTHTRELMEQRGIDSYFSGCLTLTFKPFADVAPSHAIVLTDVSDSVADYARRLFPDRPVIRMTHRLTGEERGADWPLREARVISYLKTYQAADLVITPRLHCALPSLALGTPVVLIGNFNEDFQNRLSDYAAYCICCGEEELMARQGYEDLLRNAADGMTAAGQSTMPDPATLAACLTKTCSDFIRTVSAQEPDVSLLPEPALYRELYVDRTHYMRRALVHMLDACQTLEQQHIHDVSVMNQLLATAKKALALSSDPQ